MNYNVYDNTGKNVELAEMLACREKRAALQRELLNAYHGTLLCFTMNIAGPIKSTPLIRRGFALGQRLIEDGLRSRKITVLYRTCLHEDTGSEAFYMLDAEPSSVKRLCCGIEDETPAGRLFDMDVLEPGGQKIARSGLGLPPRRCFICSEEAAACARSRKHSVAELQKKTEELLRSALDAEDADRITALAVRALLYEVCTSPKPGLVDRYGNGSHKDMDIFTFIDSTAALIPYFRECFMTGRRTAHQPAAETFSAIRKKGIRAEERMLAATRGVNTHKGAIFSVGIVCAALGRLPADLWKAPEAVLRMCASMAEGIVERDLAGLKEEDARTVGQKLYLHYGISGVRGQMEAGLPAVREAGIPVFEEGIQRGLCVNDAGCAALLAIMAHTTDTNLIARSDIATQKETVKQIRELLAGDPYPSPSALEALDRQFVAKNLSPGGSADLLAVTYLLYFLKTED